MEFDSDERAGHLLIDALTGASLGEVSIRSSRGGDQVPSPLGDGTWLTAGDGHLDRWAAPFT